MIDLQQTLTKTDRLDNSTIIVYGRKAGRAALLKEIIDEAKKPITVIDLEEGQLVNESGKGEIYTNDAAALDELIGRASRIVGKPNLIGVIKGKTAEDNVANDEAINKELAGHRIPAVYFSSNDGVYSFADALNTLMKLRKDLESGVKVTQWYRKLPPVTRADVLRLYEEYMSLLAPALSA